MAEAADLLAAARATRGRARKESGERFRKAAQAHEHQGADQSSAEPKPASKAEARARRLRAKRDLIETVIGMLADQFALETTREHSLWGVMTRLGAKLLV